MAKSQKKNTDFLNDLALRILKQSIACHPEQLALGKNAIQQAKADELLHEQERSMQKDLDMLHLTLELQEVKKGLHKVRKSMNEMETYVSTLDKCYRKMEKKIQKLSDKIDALEKNGARQKANLKKYGSKIHQQKKAICFMGAYIGVNNPADNLGKVLDKCSRQLDTGYRRNFPRIIDAEYREVTK